MGFGAAQVSKGEKEMLDQVRRGGLTGLTGPEPSRSARRAHRQLSASAVGSIHRIVRRRQQEQGPEGLPWFLGSSALLRQHSPSPTSTTSESSPATAALRRLRSRSAPPPFLRPGTVPVAVPRVLAVIATSLVRRVLCAVLLSDGS